jgi:non-heme chloroperoxidase
MRPISRHSWRNSTSKTPFMSATRPAPAKWCGTSLGAAGVAKVVLVGAVTPLMVKTSRSPAGLPIEAFNGMRVGVLADRSQFLKDLSGPFYGANRPDAKVSQAIRDAFWLQGMQAGIPGILASMKAFSESDHTDDLKTIDVPTEYGLAQWVCCA